MLKAKVLNKVLQQAVSGGIKSCILITMEGDLLAASGMEKSDRAVAAIVLNIWMPYQKATQDLKCLLIDCEEGRLAVTRVSDFLLCAYGDNTTEMGMLKAKLLAVQNYLQEPLSSLKIHE